MTGVLQNGFDITARLEKHSIAIVSLDKDVILTSLHDFLLKTAQEMSRKDTQKTGVSFYWKISFLCALDRQRVSNASAGLSEKVVTGRTR